MVKGNWHKQGSAAQQSATLTIREDYFTLEIQDALPIHGKLLSLDVSSRIGNVQRNITLKDGSVFCTSDNDSIDLIFKNHLKGEKLVHKLESKLHLVLISLVVAILTAFIFFKWGVPWASKQIAHALPYETNNIISANTLDFLDKYLLEKSKISIFKQKDIISHFHNKLAPLSEDKDIKYKLHFRLWEDSNKSIPNAFALPSGDIVLTDKFIELCKNQEEMDSVLLHEMGHVVHRHTLETVLETTFITVSVMLIMGDPNGMADMGVGVGSLLVSSSYSRGHESEADMYAFKHMLTSGIDPIAFSNIMNAMTSYMKENEKTKKEKEDDESILNYLSSHPNTKQRVKIAQEFSKCFKAGLTECKIDKAILQAQ